MVLVRNTLEIKHLQLLKIRRMNVEAEVVKSFGDNAPDDFQKKYATFAYIVNQGENTSVFVLLNRLLIS